MHRAINTVKGKKGKKGQKRRRAKLVLYVVAAAVVIASYVLTLLIARLRCLVTRAGLLAANTNGCEDAEEAGSGHMRAVTTWTTLCTSGKALLASLDQRRSGVSSAPSSPRRNVTSKDEARPFFRVMVRAAGLQVAATA
jgi:hypothetical protein